MRIEFHIVDDKDLPPLTISHNGGLFPIVYLNQHHRLWLGLMRNAILGVAVQLQDKLTELCDGYLREQIALEKFDRGEVDE